MKHTAKEEARTRKLLRRYGITPEDVKQFACLCRPMWGEKEAEVEGNYGPGLFHIETNYHATAGGGGGATAGGGGGATAGGGGGATAGGRCLTIKVHTRNHPSALLNTLLALGKPCTNLHPAEAVTGEAERECFCRPSLYMFWYFVVFLMTIIMEFWCLTSLTGLLAAILGIAFGGLCFYALFLLLTHFCYLSIEAESLDIHSVGRTVSYPYSRVRKVNFDFARELNSTHVMELIEQVGQGEAGFLRYHLYYIGRVPRKRLNELAEKLQQQGIDATCSLNDAKRHYHDTLHLQHN